MAPCGLSDFHQRDILISFLSESLILCTLGGLLGLLATVPLNALTLETSNFNTFASVLISFRFGPLVMTVALVMTLAMGLFGGMFPPSGRASRCDFGASRAMTLFLVSIEPKSSAGGYRRRSYSEGVVCPFHLLLPRATAGSRRATSRIGRPPRRVHARRSAAQRVDGSVALAHIAFWDRQRLCLMRRWAAGNWCNGGYDGELFNEVLQPFLEAIPPERAAEMALKTAEEVDAFLLTIPDEVVEAALARPDRPNLDRARTGGPSRPD